MLAGAARRLSVVCGRRKASCRWTFVDDENASTSQQLKHHRSFPTKGAISEIFCRRPSRTMCDQVACVPPYNYQFKRGLCCMSLQHVVNQALFRQLHAEEGRMLGFVPSNRKRHISRAILLPRTCAKSFCVARWRSRNDCKVMVSPLLTAMNRRVSTSTHCLRISAIANRRGGTKENNPVLNAADA